MSKAATDKARQTTISYGEFAAGMKDPAQRTAIMERIYGRGAVSWLDAATAGAGGGERISRMESDAAKQKSESEGFASRLQSGREAYGAATAAEEAADAAKVAAADKTKKEREAATEEARQEAFARWYVNKREGYTDYDPNRIYGTGRRGVMFGKAAEYSTDPAAHTERAEARRVLAEQEAKGMRWAGTGTDERWLPTKSDGTIDVVAPYTWSAAEQQKHKWGQ